MRILTTVLIIIVFTTNVFAATTPTLFIKNIDYNALGQKTKIEYGNGVVTEYYYNIKNFRLIRILSKNAKGTIIQDLNYTYDGVGNIMTITDYVNTATQSFKYDHANRLIFASNSKYGSKSYTYDTNGNIKTKDGLTYSYGTTRPHAVKTLSNGIAFTYDANGNALTKAIPSPAGGFAATTSFTYDKLNYISKATKNGATLVSYSYDGDGGKTIRTDGITGITKKYVGNLYETSPSLNVKHLYVGGSLFASVVNGIPRYFLSDHLGGTNVVLDSSGAIKEKAEYEPYGNFSRNEKIGTTESMTDKYFAGRQLEANIVSYVLANGRIYDQAIGRFLQPDNIVQSPGIPQLFNRYTYANNNPVNNVDPSGNWFFALIATIVKAVISFASAHPVIFGGITGAVSGGASAGIQGGSTGQIFQNMGIGLATGAALGGLGAFVKGPVASWPITGAAFGAVGSAISGGSPAQGAIGGAIGGLATRIGGVVMNQGFFGAGAIGSIIANGGQSVIENAMMGKPNFSRYEIYVGPLSIELSKGIKPQYGISSILSAYYLAKAIKNPNMSLDLYNTISAGTPVFTGWNGEPRLPGKTFGNNIIVLEHTCGYVNQRNNGSGHMQSVLGHESAHAHITGRMGGAWGPMATDVIHTLMSDTTEKQTPDGHKYLEPSFGGPTENWDERMASSFPIYGE